MNNIINRIADRVTDFNDTSWSMNIHHFDWVPGVGLYGIYKAYKATGNRKYYDFLISWTKDHLNEAYDNKTINSTAPLMTVADLYTECGDPCYMKVMKDIGEYIVNEAPITKDGGLEHTVTEAVEGFGDQIWADTLFMSCLFLAKLGRLCDEKKYTDFAVKQFLLHHKLLSDGNGLYFHAYNGAKKNHMSAVRWGRANAWIVLGSMELIEILGEFEGKDELERYVKNHCAALKRVQKPDGGFATVINNPDSYTEISASAGIAAGIAKAIKAGIVDKSEYCRVVDAAAKCVEAAVAEDGTVTNVSTGTPVMNNEAGYEGIALTSALYGQALAIALFAELN